MNGRRVPPWLTRLAVRVLALVLFVAAWQALVTVFEIRRYLIPPPAAVWGRLVDSMPLLWRHTRITAVGSLAGLGLAWVVGVGLAIVLVRWAAVRMVVMPGLVAFNAVPKVALAPILIVWLGIGVATKVAMAFMLAVFPIVVITTAAMREVAPELLDLVRLMRGGQWQQFTRVRIPHALPAMFSAVRVAIPLAIVGAIVAEFLTPSAGLGYLMISASVQLRTDLVFAAVVMVVVFSLFLYGVVGVAERRFAGWSPGSGPDAGGTRPS